MATKKKTTTKSKKAKTVTTVDSTVVDDFINKNTDTAITEEESKEFEINREEYINSNTAIVEKLEDEQLTDILKKTEGKFNESATRIINEITNTAADSTVKKEYVKPEIVEKLEDEQLTDILKKTECKFNESATRIINEITNNVSEEIVNEVEEITKLSKEYNKVDENNLSCTFENKEVNPLSIVYVNSSMGVSYD